MCYDGVAKTLHWLVVALIAGQFFLTWTMPHIPRAPRSGGLRIGSVRGGPRC